MGEGVAEAEEALVADRMGGGWGGRGGGWGGGGAGGTTSLPLGWSEMVTDDNGERAGKGGGGGGGGGCGESLSEAI